MAGTEPDAAMFQAVCEIRQKVATPNLDGAWRCEDPRNLQIDAGKFWRRHFCTRFEIDNGLCSGDWVPLTLGPGPIGGQPRPTSIQVRTGDTLSGLARRHFGSASLWPMIYGANRKSIGSDPNRISVGAQLSIN